MWKYVLKRIGLAFLTAFIILSISYLLIGLLPFQKPLGDANAQFGYYLHEVFLGNVIDSPVLRPELSSQPLFSFVDPNTAITHHFYQVPLMQRYFSWLKNIITRWDWGTSVYMYPNLSATSIILDRMPVSISINLISSLIAVPIGILLGIVAALKKNKATDNIISTGVMVAISIPSFVLITFLMLIFCYKLKWLPTQWPSSTAPLGQKVLGYILPVTCLSFGSIAGYCRFTRAELCEVMSSEYLLLARTKGLTKRQAILRHALRNAMVPIIPSILAEVIAILGGSMILENLYGITGIGELFVKAMGLKDYNVLFVDMALFTTIGLLSGVLLDISYGFIDPRIRMGAKK